MKGIKLVILFGSQATGKFKKDSDTDIAVLADHPLDLKEISRISEKISEKLGVSEDKLDIIDLWSAPPLLQQQVAKNGELIEGDEVDFLRFKVLAWKRYQDTAKFRRAKEKALEKSIYAK